MKEENEPNWSCEEHESCRVSERYEDGSHKNTDIYPSRYSSLMEAIRAFDPFQEETLADRAKAALDAVVQDELDCPSLDECSQYGRFPCPGCNEG